MVGAVVGMEEPDEHRQFPSRVWAAQIDRMLAPSRMFSAQIDRMLAPSRMFSAQIDRMLAPSRAAMAMLGPISTKDLEALNAGADFFGTVNAAEVLHNESTTIVEDPATWFNDMETAAKSGDERAKSVMLLAMHLIGCFLLLARRLDPSTRTIERAGPLVALSLFLTVVVGTMNASDPKLLEKLNLYLSTPVGIVGLYLALRPSVRKVSAWKYKPSKPHRGSSKPTKRTFRRRR